MTIRAVAYQSMPITVPRIGGITGVINAMQEEASAYADPTYVIALTHALALMDQKTRRNPEQILAGLNQLASAHGSDAVSLGQYLRQKAQKETPAALGASLGLRPEESQKLKQEMGGTAEPSAEVMLYHSKQQANQFRKHFIAKLAMPLTQDLIGGGDSSRLLKIKDNLKDFLSSIETGMKYGYVLRWIGDDQANLPATWDRELQQIKRGDGAKQLDRIYSAIIRN